MIEEDEVTNLESKSKPAEIKPKGTLIDKIEKDWEEKGRETLQQSFENLNVNGFTLVGMAFEFGFKAGIDASKKLENLGILDKSKEQVQIAFRTGVWSQVPLQQVKEDDDSEENNRADMVVLTATAIIAGFSTQLMRLNG